MNPLPLTRDEANARIRRLTLAESAALRAGPPTGELPQLPDSEIVVQRVLARVATEDSQLTGYLLEGAHAPSMRRALFRVVPAHLDNQPERTTHDHQ